MSEKSSLPVSSLATTVPVTTGPMAASHDRGRKLWDWGRQTDSSFSWGSSSWVLCCRPGRSSKALALGWGSFRKHQEVPGQAPLFW